MTEDLPYPENLLAEARQTDLDELLELNGYSLLQAVHGPRAGENQYWILENDGGVLLSKTDGEGSTMEELLPVLHDMWAKTRIGYYDEPDDSDFDLHFDVAAARGDLMRMGLVREVSDALARLG